jgi:hypothetical protein
MDTAEMGQYEHDEDVSKLRAEIERLKDIIINLGYEPAIGGGK